MKYKVNSSKYEAILNAVALPGRVGTEECSLDLIFFNLGLKLCFSGGEMLFSNSLKLEFVQTK